MELSRTIKTTAIALALFKSLEKEAKNREQQSLYI